MRAIIALALKDIKLLMRDRFGLFWLLAFPLMMALFFGSIFSSGDSERASMKVAIVDHANSEVSGSFVARLDSSSALTVVLSTADTAKILVRQGQAVAFLEILPGFGEVKNMFSGDTSAALVIGVDPSRTAEVGYLNGLIMEAWFAQVQSIFASPARGRSMISDLMGNMKIDSGQNNPQGAVVRKFLGQLDTFLAQSDTGILNKNTSSSSAGLMAGPKIRTESILREQTGPRSSWEITFPQALLWALIGCTAAFAITIVTERTKGTMVRLRQAPVSRAQILAGKGLACFTSAVSVSFLLLAIGVVIFGVRTPDKLTLLLAVLCSAFCFVGLMMLISVLGKSEQSVAGAGWAILLVFSMTGGGMVPLLAMPKWMLTVSNLSPVKWGIYALEGAIWRGFTLAEMVMPLAILLTIGVVAFSTGVMIFRKTD